jgi:hypothetical protein
MPDVDIRGWMLDKSYDIDILNLDGNNLIFRLTCLGQAATGESAR